MPSPKATGSHGSSRPGPRPDPATAAAATPAPIRHASRPRARLSERSTLRSGRCAADLLGEGITQSDGAVEHRAVWRRVRIAHEITLPLELHWLYRIACLRQ